MSENERELAHVCIFAHSSRSSGAFSSVLVHLAVTRGFQTTSCADLTKQNWSNSSTVKHFELSFQSLLRLFFRVHAGYPSQTTV